MDAATEDTAPRAPGALLAAERERQGLARADIAQRLHMSVSQIEALESGDYARLPRGTFLRGFVRNYARALGLDPDAALESLAEAAPRDPAPGIVVPSQNIRFDPLGERFSSPYVKAAGVALAVLVVGFAAMYWWLFIRPTAPAAARRPAAEAPRAELAPAASAPAAAEAAKPQPEIPKAEPARAEVAKAEPARPEPAKAELAKAEPPRPDPAKAEPARAEPARAPAAKTPPAAPAAVPAPVATTVDAAQVVASGGSVIRFQFKGNSWVEIRDGRGKVLLSRINPGGSEAEVIGRPPFTVVVGNAPEVRMFYNNREFDLEPHTRVAVARFTVE